MDESRIRIKVNIPDFRVESEFASVGGNHNRFYISDSLVNYANQKMFLLLHYARGNSHLGKDFPKYLVLDCINKNNFSSKVFT